MRLALILGLSMAVVSAGAEDPRPGAISGLEQTSGPKGPIRCAGLMRGINPRPTLEARLSEDAVPSGRGEGFPGSGVAGGVLLTPDGDNGSPAVFEIEFTNAKMFPAHWLLKLNPDGSGRFDAEAGDALGSEKDQIVAGDVHRPIQLSPEFTARVFSTARQRKFFAMQCESHAKVAFQGTKRLSYSGPEGSGQCEYNYAKDKEIQSLGDSLLAVETTLMYAARLEKLLQHDRLGLDREMESLASSAHDGNAIEIGAIRETLTRIAGDEQVLERARRKARLLLTQAR